MTQVFVHYVIQDDMVSENEKYITAIFDELHHLDLSGAKYEVYRMGTNVFIHIAIFETEVANKLFIQLRSFRVFQSTLKNRISEKPIFNEVTQIGSFSRLNL